MTTNTTPNFPTKLQLADVAADARAAGCSVSFPHLRDVLVWGPAGAVRKLVAAQGLGFDTPRRGRVQSVHRLDGGTVGTVTYGDDGRASVRLCYALASC